MSSTAVIALESLVCWADDVFIEHAKKGCDIHVVALFNNSKSFGYWFDVYGEDTYLRRAISPRLDGSVVVTVSLIAFVKVLAARRLSQYGKESSIVEK